MENLLQITSSEATIRINGIKSLMQKIDLDAVLISENANKFYVSGRVYNGYA